MAKHDASRKRSADKPKSSPQSAGDTSLSTRFDENELVFLRSAANLKQWSLSQFIKQAALEKSVNILNASGERQLGVRSVLAQVVKQLLKATPEFLAAEVFTEGETVVSWE